MTSDPARAPEPATRPDIRPPSWRERSGAPLRRLVFHLDDVLPLAAHAASTSRHTLTAAQLRAGAPLMPALAWTTDNGADVLISNGAPTWHDAHGRPHTAHARSWIRRDTRGTARTGTDPAGLRSGYLPLRTFGSGLHVVDWLRHAADRGAHWLSLDISRRHPVITPDRLDVSEQRSHSYPPHAEWTPATLACIPAIGGGRYPALTCANYLATGGAEIARFDRDTVNRIITDLDQARTGGSHRPTVLRWSGDRVEIGEEHHAGIPTRRRIDVAGPDRDGLYPLGAFLWTWLRTDLT